MTLDFFRRELGQVFIDFIRNQRAYPGRNFFSQEAEGARGRSENQMLERIFFRCAIEPRGDVF